MVAPPRFYTINNAEVWAAKEEEDGKTVEIWGKETSSVHLIPSFFLFQICYSRFVLHRNTNMINDGCVYIHVKYLVQVAIDIIGPMCV